MKEIILRCKEKSEFSKISWYNLYILGDIYFIFILSQLIVLSII